MVALGTDPRAEARLSAGSSEENRELLRETRRGTERLSLNFSDVARAIRDLASSLSSRRIWLLLDEWSSVPNAIQPYLGEFLVRCVLPLQDRLTVKIAAIEQQSRFREELPSGQVIGIELGADVAANVDLDEFMVFEQNEERARTFFRGLLFKHVTAGSEGRPDPAVAALRHEADLVRQGSPTSARSTNSSVPPRASHEMRSTSPRALRCGRG